jgi:predicted enzyme related to lactoylglutathione lyase
MPNHLKHFAINCEDVARARGFYESAFGWKFSPGGPPDFFRTSDAASDGIVAAIQKRREIVPGKPMFGYECSFSVVDIDATIAAVEANGGRIVMPKVAIPTVGKLIFFEDTEGNIAGAIQFDSAAG